MVQKVRRGGSWRRRGKGWRGGGGGKRGINPIYYVSPKSQLLFHCHCLWFSVPVTQIPFSQFTHFTPSEATSKSAHLSSMLYLLSTSWSIIDAPVRCFKISTSNDVITFPTGKYFWPLGTFILLVILWSPILREIALWLRVVDVGLESCRYVLTQIGPGHSLVLIPGGAAESLDSSSKEYILTLNRRRQFIKMALETGYESDF